MNSIKLQTVACLVALTPLLSMPVIAGTGENSEARTYNTQSYTNTSYADQSNTNTSYSEAELAQILAPIALYPDSLLSHILIASTYPIDVIEAQRWRKKHSRLNAFEAVKLAENNAWDPSVIALVAFVNVLQRLHDDIQWTQTVGDAFLEDEQRVLQTVQALRHDAQSANSFSNMPHMRVSQVNQQIIIEPRQRDVLYVPYYDTRIVFGDWRWHRYPPMQWDYSPHIALNFSGRNSSRFHWDAGININFNYFFSAFKWHSGHVIISKQHRAKSYRSHKQITSSHGAKRWKHVATNRRDIRHRSQKITRSINKPILRNNTHRVSAKDTHVKSRQVNSVRVSNKNDRVLTRSSKNQKRTTTHKNKRH
jgi:hypothetical protein